MSRASERRKSSGSGEGGGAYWMDTYGDMVTLLLTFFVLLFSFSNIDAAKWESLVGSFSGSASISIPVLNPEMAMQRPIETIKTSEDSELREQNEGNPSDPQEIIDDAGNARREYEQFLQLYENIDGYIENNGLSAQIFVDYDAYTVIVRFADNIFFDSGSADIRFESESVLDHMSHIFAENIDLIDMINIEGHTDNVPISTSQYPSNWELSVSRAVNTLRYMLLTDLIDKEKISAVGYSEFHPVETNETVAGRAANRRVDFVVQGYKSS